MSLDKLTPCDLCPEMHDCSIKQGEPCPMYAHLAKWLASQRINQAIQAGARGIIEPSVLITPAQRQIN